MDLDADVVRGIARFSPRASVLMGTPRWWLAVRFVRVVTGGDLTAEDVEELAAALRPGVWELVLGRGQAPPEWSLLALTARVVRIRTARSVKMFAWEMRPSGVAAMVALKDAPCIRSLTLHLVGSRDVYFRRFFRSFFCFWLSYFLSWMCYLPFQTYS